MTKTYPDDLIDILAIPVGTMLREWHEDSVYVVVKRANFSMNVYMGVPVSHPLANQSYDDLPVDCHGGLTYSSKGDGEYLPQGYYWYGYDYVHAGDYMWSEHTDISEKLHDKQWSLGEIVKDARNPVYNMKRLMRLAENIHGK